MKYWIEPAFRHKDDVSHSAQDYLDGCGPMIVDDLEEAHTLAQQYFDLGEDVDELVVLQPILVLKRPEMPEMVDDILEGIPETEVGTGLEAFVLNTKALEASKKKKTK